MPTYSWHYWFEYIFFWAHWDLFLLWSLELVLTKNWSSVAVLLVPVLHCKIACIMIIIILTLAHNTFLLLYCHCHTAALLECFHPCLHSSFQFHRLLQEGKVSCRRVKWQNASIPFCSNNTYLYTPQQKKTFWELCEWVRRRKTGPFLDDDDPSKKEKAALRSAVVG